MRQEQIIEMFREKGFRATPQRVAVFEYLFENRIHPDPDSIYKSVIKNHPGFSKTTVYNALRALCENGFVIPVTIDETRTHYDANVGFHGHFKCSCCSRIFDFDVPACNEEGLNGFSITHRDVYYSGLCPSCYNKNN